MEISKNIIAKKSWRAILSYESNEIPTESDDTTDLKFIEDLREITVENVDKKAVQQWILCVDGSNNVSRVVCC